jgi:hypothetical protein
MDDDGNLKNVPDEFDVRILCLAFEKKNRHILKTVLFKITEKNI